MNLKYADENRLFLFSGHYGSGKTEVSINYAMRLATAYRTTIVDFDIVNPYYRTADARGGLEAKGIRVIASQFAKSNADAPAMPAEISSVFDDKGVKAVFDVGGDSAGARATSVYRDYFLAEKYFHFFIFNIRRQITSTVSGLIEAFYDIQGNARLPFTALINNTNLMDRTGPKDLFEGLETACELSERLSLPLAFSTYMEGASPSAADADSFFERSREFGTDVFILKKHIRMPN